MRRRSHEDPNLTRLRLCQLLREAFTASLEIQDTDVIRPSLQRDILDTLLPLSQADAEELLTRAEPRVRNSTAAQLVARYAQAIDTSLVEK